MTNKRLHPGCGLIAGHLPSVALDCFELHFRVSKEVTVRERDTMFWSHEEYLKGERRHHLVVQTYKNVRS
jgi:hypothetical protein